jgi:hypothetical protein
MAIIFLTVQSYYYHHTRQHNIVIVIVITVVNIIIIGIACDPFSVDGTNTIVYVADRENNLIRRIAADGNVTNYGTSITLSGKYYL